MLKHRLSKVGDVVDDNVTIAVAVERVGEVFDMLRKIKFTTSGRREAHTGAGRQVMDQLHHRPAFVSTTDGILYGKDPDRKIAVCYVGIVPAPLTCRLETIAQHAHSNSRAVEFTVDDIAAYPLGFQCPVGFTGYRAHMRYRLGNRANTKQAIAC